jgi:predicted TPR repeat methyltransferase
LRLQPNNKALAYTVESLSKNQRLLLAPPDYIETLFDAYADHYETHLIDALDYQLPTHMMQLLKNHLLPQQTLDRSRMRHWPMRPSPDTFCKITYGC